MGFEAFTKAFDSAYKSTSERQSMFDEEDKKSSSHWGNTEVEETTDTKGDEYATFLTTFDTEGSKTLLNNSPAVVGAYDNTNEADHNLLKDNNIQAFDIDQHGKKNSFLSKIWQGTFGKGDTYDNSTDYYASHLKDIKDQKGLDLVNKAKELNVSIPEQSIFDSTTYGGENYKFLEIAIANAQNEISDPDSTTNMRKKADEERIRNAKEWQVKAEAERKVETDSFEAARSEYEADQARQKDEKQAVTDRNKKTRADRMEKARIKSYNKYGDDASDESGYNPKDFDNSADAKAYYQNKKKIGDQKWWQKGFLDKRAEETAYEGDLKKHGSMMNEKDLLEAAMRNLSKDDIGYNDEDEWENETGPKNNLMKAWKQQQLLNQMREQK